MVEPFSAAAAVAEAAPAALTYVEKKLNAPVRRHDMASDNRDRLKLVEKLLEMHLRLVDDWMKEDVTQHSLQHSLLTWRTKLQHAKDKCLQLSPNVSSANQFSRVQRADQILTQVESIERDFSAYAIDEDRERMMVKDAAESLSQTQIKFRKSGTVPPNPPRLTLDYESPDTFEGKLKAAVLQTSAHKLIAVVASGRGGVGKTCALRGLNDVEDIKSRFPDGVQFMQLGSDAGMDKLTQQIAKIVEETGNRKLGKDIRGEKQLEGAVSRAKEWFIDRKCLFLVDDVWKANGFDVNTFYVLAGMINAESRLVYTTRENELAQKADMSIVFEPRRTGDSRVMFLKHSGLENYCIEKKFNKNALDRILDACGGVPLLLAVTGSGVREYFPSLKGTKEDALQLYLEKLRREPDTMIEGDVEGYGPVRNVTNASISVLELRWNRSGEQAKFPMSIREMYRSLCVLKKQQEVPVSMLLRLWCLTDERWVLEVMKALSSVAVVDVMISSNKEELSSVLRVHDEILGGLAVDTKNEKQQHSKRLLDNYLPYTGFEFDIEPKMTFANANGIGGRNSEAWFTLRRLCCCISKDNEVDVVNETTILDFARERKRREWWTIYDEDGYLDSNLCHLLKDAGEDEELIWLLLKPQWIMKRLKNDGMMAVENDVLTGKMVLECSDMNRKHEKKIALDLISQAGRLSHHAVSRNPREICFQLYGRLIEYSGDNKFLCSFLQEVEKIAGNAEGPWAKARKGFLTSAGGATLESIEVGGKVLCIRKNEAELRMLCLTWDEAVHIVKYNLKHGSRRTVEMTGRFERAAMSSDGRIAVCVDAKDNVTKWDAESDVETMIGRCETSILCIGLSEDCRWVACGLKDIGKVILWDEQSGGAPRELVTGRDEYMVCVAVSATARRVVCGLHDGAIWVWDAQSGEAICEAMEGHKSRVNCVSFSEHGDMIISGSWDGTIRMWSAETGRCLCHAEIGEWVTSVAFAERGKQVLWGTLEGAFGMWEHEGGCSVVTIGGEGDLITCVGLSQDGSVGFCGCRDGSVRVWDMRNGESRIGSCGENPHDEEISCVAMSADGRCIASGSEDGTIRLWDGPTGMLLPQVLRGHKVRVMDVSLNDDGRVLVSAGGFDETVRLWDVRSASAVGEALRGHGSVVNCVATSADGRRAASASWDCTVRVWDTLRVVALCEPLRGHMRRVTCVSMSADGSQVASASRNQTVRVWDVAAHVATHQFCPPSRARAVLLAHASVMVRLLDDSVYLCSLDMDNVTWEEVAHAAPPPLLPMSWLDASRRLEVGDAHQQRVWLGTTDHTLCRRYEFGFFCQTRSRKGFRFCIVQN